MFGAVRVVGGRGSICLREGVACGREVEEGRVQLSEEQAVDELPCFGCLNIAMRVVGLKHTSSDEYFKTPKSCVN